MQLYWLPEFFVCIMRMDVHLVPKWSYLGSTEGAIHSVINLAHPGEPLGHSVPSGSHMAYIAPGGATNGFSTWARLITEQWLLLRILAIHDPEISSKRDFLGF